MKRKSTEQKLIDKLISNYVEIAVLTEDGKYKEALDLSHVCNNLLKLLIRD